MWQYQKRMARDVARWRTAGYVTPDGEAAILAELAAARGPGLAPLLATLGAVLIGFAAMSFVAANWQEMPKGVRLGLLFGSIWISYGAAHWLAARGMSAFGQAAILLGCCLFGASIMLIAQMYHIDGHPPDAALVWAIGTLAAGALLPSNAALALAMLLVALWAGWEMALSDRVFWPFLLGWAAVAGAMAWRGWRPGLHLAAIVLALWIVSLGYALSKDHPHEVVISIGLTIAAAALYARRVFAAQSADLGAVMGYGLVIAYCGLFAIQFFEDRSTWELVAGAGMSLLLTVGAVVWGWRTGGRGLLWLGYAGFSLEILALYFKTVGSLMGSSLFFLAAGGLVMALAWLAYKLHSAGEAADEGEP